MESESKNTKRTVLIGNNSNPKLWNRFVDFLVLGITFYLSCLLLSVELKSGLLTQTLAYTTILMIFVGLCERIVVNKISVSAITRQILGNATGILIGTCVMLILEKMLSTSGEVVVAVIFSSVMAFFILGTLSPIVHKKSSSI